MAKAKEEKVLFPFKKRQNLLIQNQDKDLAMEPDSSIMRYVTESGFFLD